VQHRWIEKRPKAALYFGQGPKFFPQVQESADELRPDFSVWLVF
jgi:hypothetical protein